jgi:hypothetical protein
MAVYSFFYMQRQGIAIILNKVWNINDYKELILQEDS